MPSTTIARSVSTPLVIFAGFAAFAVGLFVLLSGGPGPRALAQNDCAQPSDTGCPMTLDTTVQAAIADPTVSHNWLLNVTDSANFVVTLTNLPGDYQLWVYGPDSSLQGLSNNAGTQDERIVVNNIGVGQYWVTVNSQNGDTSPNPYTLTAAILAATTVVPINSYDAPTRVNPYR